MLHFSLTSPASSFHSASEMEQEMIRPSSRLVLDQYFGDSVQTFTQELKALQRRARGHVPQLDICLSEITESIQQQSRHCLAVEDQLTDPEQVRSLQALFQIAIEPWFSQSWFMQRARSKPRGYPGDFVLLNGIYNRKPKSQGLGGYLDLYFLESDLGRAVPARMAALRNFLNRQMANSTGPLRIMNVACGPCREYLTGLQVPADREVRITCIDSDPEALRHAEACVSKILHGKVAVDFVNYNALRMRSAERNLARFGRQHIIYSIGLLDYLPDKHLVAVLQGLRETLADGGKLYVAFKDAERYDKAEYQWFVDWFFFQRNAAACRSLLLQAGFEDELVTMDRDATGIILNFTAAVPAKGGQWRRDLSHLSLPGPRNLDAKSEQASY